MNRLEELYEKHGVNRKIDVEFDNESPVNHKYGSFLYDYLNQYIDKFPTILELGIFEGKSMLAHNEFFNSKCKIVGVDFYDKLPFDIQNYPNMKVFSKGSEDEEVLEDVKNYKYDIIIDDNLHTYDNQLFNLYHYPDFLKEDGIYIIKNLQCNIDPLYKSNSEYGILNSTFDVLFRRKCSSLLSSEAYNKMQERIDNIILWSKTLDCENQYKSYQASMAAIIKFKY